MGNNFKLDELLRYGFSGIAFLLYIATIFIEPRSFIIAACEKDAFSSLVLIAAFTAGSIIYSLHRAIFYPIVYKLFAVYYRKEDCINLDIQRWRALNKKVSFQSKMKGWADQVHFLYCLALAGIISISLGATLGWTIHKIAWWWADVILSFILFTTAFVNHFFYQRHELRVFNEDFMEPE